MGLIDKFLDAIKLNDDYDEDDDFLDDDINEDEDDFEDTKPKHRFFKRLSAEDEDDFDEKPLREEKPAKSGSTTEKSVDRDFVKPAKKEKLLKKKVNNTKRKTGAAPMEVNVIKPTTMEDAREIADNLLDNCTVVLNLEGLDVDIAQRIIDFTCGACYSLEASIQMISNYIFIITPSNVDISGDYQSILSDAFDIPAMRSQY